MKVLAGIDVSAATLQVKQSNAGREKEGSFTNDVEGHRKLIKWLGKKARVCMEATGAYHLQLALTLRAAGIEVMVLNPRAAKDYARSQMVRSKTDRVDAGVLLDYLTRQEFVPWTAPNETTLEMRQTARRISELVEMSAMEKNRLHAKRVAGLSRSVERDVEQNIEQLKKRIKKMEKEAVSLIQKDPGLNEQYSLLLKGTGIGVRSAVLLLGELAVLDPTMTVSEIVAHAGLDPRVEQSGTSVNKPARISHVGNARVRGILYMVALSGIVHDRGAKTFYQGLLARGKARMVAVVAVMRKYLHGIWISMQRRVAFDNGVLFGAALQKAGPTATAARPQETEAKQRHPKGRSQTKGPRKHLESARPEATGPVIATSL